MFNLLFNETLLYTLSTLCGWREDGGKDEEGEKAQNAKIAKYIFDH